MGQVPPPLHKDVAAVGLQRSAVGVLLAFEVLAEFLLIAEACGRFVLLDKVRSVLIGDHFEVVAQFPVALANIEGVHRRRMAGLRAP